MSETVRILQISYGMDRGGAETLIMNIYRNIDRTKVQFDFLLHNPERTAYEDEIESLGGRIYRIPRFLGYNKFSYDRNLKKFLLSHPEYRIIHDHLMDSADETFRVAKKLGRITIAHSHIAQTYSSLSDIIRFFFRRNLYKTASYRFACSKEAGDWLYRKKADYVVLNNGIDTERYKFLKEIRDRKRNELGIAPETFLITNIGRMVGQKNQKRLLDIFALYHDTDKDSKLAVIGTGPLENELKEKTEKKGLADDVLFLGSHSDVNEILMASDLFLFPSLFEGLGIVLVEAEATGLECVFSSNIPGEVDLIPSLMTRVSLEDTDEEWARRIREVKSDKKPERNEQYLAVRNKGYDIRKSAAFMEDFYLRISGR